MIKTEAGEKMKEENPIDGIDTIDGRELLRQELEKEGKKFGMPETPEMNMGGLMGDGMGVIIGIEAESGNEIPAGSKPEEVADDIPAMLSEGEYVVPADVVRWHGVKTFEGLRCEAKMGMGLMAQDGRIAEVDGEYEHDHDSPDYDIEEKDKPKVEKAEVEVVHAAGGVSLEQPTAPTGGPYYGYRVRFNPNTQRYEFMAVDPTTQAEVTPDSFVADQATRYTPEALLGGVYGEEQTTECPDGFYFDEEAGVCMPEEEPAPASVVQPDGGDGGDGPEVDSPRVDYASQGLTKLAEALGPLSAEDLADYEGDTLADKAVSRMMTPATPVSTQGGLLGLVVSAGQNLYDDVGARRAAETRAAEFSKAPTTMQAYNFNFDPATGSFKQTNASTRITNIEDGWIESYNNVGRTGTEYSREDIFDTDDLTAFNDVLDAIDDDFTNMTAVTGGGSKNMFGSDEGTPSSPTSSGGSRTSDAADVDSGRGGMGPSGSGPSGGGGGTNVSDHSSSQPGGGYESGSHTASDDYGYAKGGYVSKKNKPKVATMKYSKGSK